MPFISISLRIVPEITSCLPNGSQKEKFWRQLLPQTDNLIFFIFVINIIPRYNRST